MNNKKPFKNIFKTTKRTSSLLLGRTEVGKIDLRAKNPDLFKNLF